MNPIPISSVRLEQGWAHDQSEANDSIFPIIREIFGGEGETNQNQLYSSSWICNVQV